MAANVSLSSGIKLSAFTPSGTSCQVPLDSGVLIMTSPCRMRDRLAQEIRIRAMVTFRPADRRPAVPLYASPKPL